MAQSVELANLRDELVRRGKELSSFTGVLFVSLAVLDALAALRGDGIAVALAGSLPKANLSATSFFWAVTIVQAGMLAFGAFKLSQSGVAGNGLVDASPVRPFGATAHIDTEAGKIWAGTAMVLLLCICGFAFSVDSPVSDKAWILLMIGAPTVALAMAALLARGYEARRRLSNSSVLIGAGAALILVLLSSILFDRPGLVAAAVSDGLAVVAGLVLCLATVAISVSFRSPTDVLIDVTVKDPQGAQMVEPYDPFDRRARAARYLRFNISKGQIVVLTLKQGAQQWIVEPSWEPQYHLPVHDRSLNIWNLNKLSTEIAQQIEVRDSSHNYQLMIEVGKIMVSAKMEAGEAYDKSAIQAASNVLFQNEDLAGLMRRSAARAFSRQIAARLQENKMGTLAEEIARIVDFLEGAPTSSSIIGGVNFLEAESVAAISAPTMAKAKVDIAKYNNDFADQQKIFRKINDLVKEAAQAMKDAWLEELAIEITNAGKSDHGSGPVETKEALRVLRLIGICSTDQKEMRTGVAAECEEKFATVKANVAQLLDEVSSKHVEALQREDDHGRRIEETIVGNARFTRKDAAGIATVAINKRHKSSLIKGTETDPIRLIGHERALDDDEEDLN